MPLQEKFGVRSIRNSPHEMMAALYLQVSIVSQALIFVTRSRSWSFIERPGLLLVSAFIVAQLVSILQPIYPSPVLIFKKYKQNHVTYCHVERLSGCAFSGCNFGCSICKLGFC